MQISPIALRLPLLLDLIERHTWQEIIDTPSLYKLHAWSDKENYPYDNGGKATVDKMVSFLSPFMQYCYQVLVDEMLNYTLPAEEAVQEYKNIPAWQYNQYPRHAHREHIILAMEYIYVEEHKNLEVVLDKFKLFFYTTPEGIIKHVKKEN